MGRMDLVFPTVHDSSRSRTPGLRRPLHALLAQGLVLVPIKTVIDLLQRGQTT